MNSDRNVASRAQRPRVFRAAVAIIFALLTAVCLAPPGATLAADQKKETAVVVTASGEHSFEVEIADRVDTRSRGLMFRRSLGPREGMLFFYDEAQHISMWMRNTYIPLDMIFINADGTVYRIEERTEPFSERVIESGARVLAVLEVKGGTAAEMGLRPGDRVGHPRFDTAGRR